MIDKRSLLLGMFSVIGCIKYTTDNDLAALEIIRLCREAKMTLPTEAEIKQLSKFMTYVVSILESKA